MSSFCINSRARLEEFLFGSDLKSMVTKISDFTYFSKQMSVPVVLVSLPERKIVMVNESCEELFGYSIGEMIELEINKIFAAQNRKNIDAIIEICITNALGLKVREGDLFIRRKTGRRCLVEASCSLIELDNQKYILFNLIDLSMLHSKQIEKDQLLQDNLRISKLADLARLTTGLTHELNNPLSVISGYTDIIEENLNNSKKSVEDIKKNIKPIKNNIARMSYIISKLMKMFRSDEIKLNTVSVRSLINIALATIKNQIANTNIIVTLEIEDLNITCDLLYTEQVILNIFNNAISALVKFTDLRMINIRTSETANEIIISIHNNGALIPEENFDKLFTPFFTTKQVNEGVGLGLYLAQNIMKTHEGKITFESNAKKGTIFYLHFPRRASMFSVSEATHKNIVLLTENIGYRDQLSPLLVASGLKVSNAKNVSEANQEMTRSLIDAIVIDIDFKKENSYQTYLEFIKLNTLIPIVIVTKNFNHLELKKIEIFKNIYIFSSDLTQDEVNDIALLVNQYQLIKDLKSA